MADHFFKTIIPAIALGTVLTAAAPFLSSGFGASSVQAQGIIEIGRGGNTTQRISLGLDKSIVVDLPADAHDILVANPEVADAVSRTARRIYLFGKQVGETNIFVFDRNGNQLVSLDLQVERDVAGLDENLARFIPGSNIKSEIINDNIVLTGTVQTPQDAARATQLAEIFVKGGDATTQEFDAFFFGATGDSQIVNLLQIVGGDQVTLKVTVAEIQRSVVKQLGTSLNISGGTPGDFVFSGLSTGNFSVLGKPAGSNAVSLGGSIGNVDIGATFRAMEETGVMKTLAEPTLTAVSGETAIFRAGGEYNIVDGATRDPDTGQVTIDTRVVEYGVGLEFTPVVLSPGRISLKIRTSVSEPTMEGSIPGFAGDATIMSIRRRLADTTVELPSGGSLMIAGLLRDDVRQVASGFPGLSNLPVLGALFRSNDYVRNETEMVVVVTPYLSRPVAQAALSRPTDNFQPPSDVSAVLLGRLNRIYGSANTQPPPGDYHGAIGFIYK